MARLANALNASSALTQLLLEEDAAIDAEFAAHAAKIAQLEKIIEDLRNPPQNPSPPGPQEYNVFVAPIGRGKGDGTSESDACALGNLELPGFLSAGDRIGLLPGEYKQLSPINLNSGGTPDKPVLIRGLGTALGDVLLRGYWNPLKEPFVMPSETAPKSRAVNAPGWNFGWLPLWVLENGANWITFENLAMREFQYAFRFAGSVEGITIQDSKSFCCFDHIYQKYGIDAGCKKLRVRRYRAEGYPKSAIRLNGKTEDVEVEDFLADSGLLTGGDFAMGIFMSGLAHNIHLTRVTSRRNLDINGTSYWNADGFVSENGNYDIWMEDCLAELNSDGGYDLKSRGTHMKNVLARKNKINFKFWGEAEVENGVSENPQKFVIRDLTGGSGGFFDLEVNGGRNAADATNVKCINSPTLQHKWHTTIPDNADPHIFHGDVVFQ